MLPAWMKIWWRSLGPAAEPRLILFIAGNKCIGYAPLYLEGSQAYFIGSQNVCDYLDFGVITQESKTFCQCLFDYLANCGITSLDFNPVRADSFVQTQLAPMAQSLGYKVVSEETDSVYEMNLPSDWESYLQQLKGKHRHEIKRKLRRLHEAGQVTYRTRCDTQAIDGAIDLFFRLFSLNNSRKAAFMTDAMEAFFRSLIKAMAELNLVQLNCLEIDGEPAAVTLCFDDCSTVYLYNNGYDPRFQSLSVGLLCKVMGIQDSIARGRSGYSFLKGKEAYKQRLGGKEVPIYRCQIQG
jgi:CelD/BcsL family acetyltransferase involved in cellulose biosynthesis